MTAKIKVGGVWKDVNQGFIKVSGAWKTISQAQIKVSGAWKSVGLGQIVQNGLQLLLDANAYSGTGNWQDTSGNNNHATPTNGPEFVANGDRSYFNLNYHRRDEGAHYLQLTNGLDVQNDFTIGFWIRQNATQFRESMDKDVFIGNHNGFNSLSIYKNSGFGSGNEYACAKEGTYSNPKLEFNNSDTGDDEIFNIVITRDNSFTPDRWTIFINGAKTNPITGATLNNPVESNDMTGLNDVDTIGAGYDSSNFENDTFQGRVYHFMYYDTVLTDSQILQNYNVLKSRYDSDDVCPLNTENLELYLNTGLASSLDNTLTTGAIPQGTIWYDLSGKSNNFGFGNKNGTTDTPNTHNSSTYGFDVVKPSTITSNVTGAVYLASHNDLITAFGTNVASAINHWTANGLSEGRNIDWDVAAYLEHNPDLFSGTAGNGNPFYTDLEQTAIHLAANNSTEARADAPHANIKSSLLSTLHLQFNGSTANTGHARSALNADFFKFGETTDFTIGVWIRIISHAVADGIISCGNVNHGGSFLLQTLNSGSYTASFGFRRNKASGVNNTDETFSAPANSLKAGGRWQYIAITCDRDTITKLYVDGFRVASDTDADLRTGNIGTLTEQSSTNLVSATDVDNVFRVGDKREENGQPNARIAQVHIWKRCLDERQMLEAYNNTKAKYNHPQNLYSDG